MRRMTLATAAVVSIAVLLVPGGAVTAKRGRERVTCDVAPFTYAVHSGGWRTDEFGRGVLRYSASGTTTLSCPDGHPLNGSEVSIEVLEAKFVAGSGELMTETASLKGRAQYRIQGGFGGIGWLGLRIRGTSTPNEAGTVTLDLNVTGRKRNGSTLRLHEVGTFDPITTELVSLSCMSGTLGVIFSRAE